MATREALPCDEQVKRLLQMLDYQSEEVDLYYCTRESWDDTTQPIDVLGWHRNMNAVVFHARTYAMSEGEEVYIVDPTGATVLAVKADGSFQVLAG